MLTFHAIFILTIVKALFASPTAILLERNSIDQLISNNLPNLPLEKCDYYCTRMDLPICAGNGQCLQRFRSECAMQAYNCKYPLKPFTIVQDALCEQSWAPICQTRELGNQ